MEIYHDNGMGGSPKTGNILDTQTHHKTNNVAFLQVISSPKINSGDQSDIHSQIFCSGFGQYHSNEKGVATRKPYSTININDIYERVDNPQQVDKTQAQWLIPSILLSRIFKEQEDNGKYWLLWADLDKNPKPIDQLASIIELLGCDYEIYTSRSATIDCQKAHILIPLKSSLYFADWILCQQILNDLLESNGATPDRANERAAQLCYLPNRGEFYKSLSKRNNSFFNPLEFWSDEIQNKQTEIARQAAEIAKDAEAASKRRSELKSSVYPNNELPDLIGAFNEAYSVQEILLKAGYQQRGDSFRHPNSQSGSYSASVKNRRVHSLSPNDPLYTGGRGGGAHDAFSAFTILFHQGKRDDAIKDAGDHWLMIGSDSWNIVKKREYRHQKTSKVLQPDQHFIYGNDQDSFSLHRFDITRSIEEMKTKMLDDVFVMKGIALRGQITALYASPNTGKTLLTIKKLIDSVQAGRISGKNVFYINADDTYKGMITKAEILMKYNITMIVPGYNNFKAKDFVKYLNRLINADTANGVIIVLDTLKKFSDLMNKKDISQFMTVARNFVSHGGTLIMLAHTNKRRDVDNKLIAGGTSDVIDDADCAYIIDAKPVMPGDLTKTVIFENVKNRGNVERELCFSYSIQQNQSYSCLVNSVKKHSQIDLQKVKDEAEFAMNLEKDLPVIEIIEEVIKSGCTKKTELVMEVHTRGGGTHKKIREILERYKGKRWGVIADVNNSSIYHLIGKESTVEEYLNGKEGY